MRAWVVLAIFGSFLVPAAAAEDFAASFRLRGGYDSNPLLAPNGKGAAFVTLEGVLAAGRTNDGGWVNGLSLETSATKFSEPDFNTFQNHRLRLRLSNDNVEDYSVDATTTFAAARSYDTQIALAAQRLHLQYVNGKLRPFVAGDVRAVSLNELNPLLGDFLPEPMRLLRGSITPGVAYVEDNSEIGVSLLLGHSKYEGSTDLFGYQRDHNRAEASLYAKYTSDALSLRGAVSYLHAYMRDDWFTDVSHLLFDFGASAKWGPGWSAEVSLAQTAEETTFPVSPLTINRVFSAKLSRDLNDKTNVGIFTRRVLRNYWDTPLYSRVHMTGIEVSHIVSPDITLAAELSLTRSQLLSRDLAEGVVATVGLTKRFSAEQKK